MGHVEGQINRQPDRNTQPFFPPINPQQSFHSNHGLVSPKQSWVPEERQTNNSPRAIPFLPALLRPTNLLSHTQKTKDSQQGLHIVILCLCVCCALLAEGSKVQGSLIILQSSQKRVIERNARGSFCQTCQLWRFRSVNFERHRYSEHTAEPQTWASPNSNHYKMFV